MTFRERLTGPKILYPLRNRDFALLTGGSTISLLGDGFFFIALAWQVYEISNIPTALSIVWVAWTLPSVIFLLIGGAFSDRYDRRLLMIGADIIRALAIGAIGFLSIAGVLEIWHIAVLIAFVGLGDAFFNPASTAIVPDLLPDKDLPQANALLGTMRPLMVRLIGPALAGFVVAAVGSGTAFVIDGASFLVSAVAVAAIRPRPMHVKEGGHGVRKTISQVREGLGFVRRTPWLWATLLSAMLSLLAFFGPVETLVPFLVKNRLNLGPESLGLLFAVGGVGAILTGVAIGQFGLPRKRVTIMYASWSFGVALMAIYGLMTELWHALIASFITHALFQLGQVIWTTMLQTLVPRKLLGRVTSVDWLVSTGLVPVSFALTGPAAETFGAAETMVGASLIGAVLMGALLFVPGVRDPERTEADERGPKTDRAAAAAPD
ncbi:MAG: MFS transporter [Candidatus Limnocylindrales bacterium]